MDARNRTVNKIIKSIFYSNGGDIQQAHSILDGDKCYREKLDKLRCVHVCVFMSRLGDASVYCIV